MSATENAKRSSKKEVKGLDVDREEKKNVRNEKCAKKKNAKNVKYCEQMRMACG